MHKVTVEPKDRKLISPFSMKVGDVGEIVEGAGGATGHLLHTYQGWVLLENPEMTWGYPVNWGDSLVRVLPKGAKVTIVLGEAA